MKPRISMIVAMAENRAIGKNNDLLWRLPDDTKYFRDMTRGKPIIEGERTFRSIKKPLPDRINIIMSKDSNLTLEGATVVHSADEALAAAGDVPEVMVCGGGMIYKEFLPRADRLYITLVHTTLEGDTYFPEFNWDDWNVISKTEHAADDRHQYAFTFYILDRRN